MSEETKKNKSMADNTNKDEKLIIRVNTNLKYSIEATAKKHNKTVSDFVRDTLILIVGETKEAEDYLRDIQILAGAIEKKKELQNKIYECIDAQAEYQLFNELTYTIQSIYDSERTILKYLQNKDF